MNDSKISTLTYLSLFSSGGTLICCALPALLVTLGAGAVFASFTEQFPIIFVLLKHKSWFFSVTGLLLFFLGFFLYKNRYAACPADPALAKACKKMRVINRLVYFLSLTVFSIGLYFSYGYGLFYE